MATRFGHLCLFVKDLARSEEFYIRHFGLVLEKEVPGLDGNPSAFLALNGATFLELWQHEPAGNMPGHVALWIDDIHAFAESMRAQGIAVSDLNLRPSGNTIAFLDDPDGNCIELLCAPKKG